MSAAFLSQHLGRKLAAIAAVMLSLSASASLFAADAVAARQADLNTAFTDTVALFADGKVALAEQRLTSLNNAKQGTAQWHLEAAQRLLSMGNYFHAQHQGAVVDQIASRALAQTDLALTKAGTDAKIQSRAQILAGVVRDQLLHDRAGALSNFQAANQLDPQSERAAHETNRLNLAAQEHARGNKKN